MRSGVKTRLKAAFSDPELSTKLGIAPPSSAASSDADEQRIFTEQVVPALYGALNAILVAAPRRFGYSAEASSVMAFSRDEIAGFAPLTGKVLAKHLGGRSKYQEEYLLATTILLGIMGKVSMLEKQARVIALTPRPSADEPRAEPLPS